MKKKEEINVKGITHKIQTYQVIGTSKSLPIKNIILNEEYDGFNLEVNLNISDKHQVVASLEKVLKQLKNKG